MKKRILVIDDEEMIRTAITVMLKSSGYDVVQCADGEEGMREARSILPDLIVCDVNMPKLDGFGVVEELRKDASTATIPFVFLTGRGEEHRRKGMELGADDFLNKPFGVDELLAAVHSRLKRQQVIFEQAEKKLSELRESITLALPHELRTPLQGILGFAELLEKDTGNIRPQEILELAQHIRKSAKRLHHTLENMLMYAQAEIVSSDQGQLKKLRNVRTTGGGLIVKIAAEGKAKDGQRAEDLRIKLKKVDADLPIDEIYLRKVIEELVDNALKFSQNGTPVTVNVEEGRESVTIHIQDSGRGMSAEQIARFGAFTQFNRRVYEQQGSGLGFALAKRLTELHGGTLTVRSELGTGTTVSVRFARAQDP